MRLVIIQETPLIYRILDCSIQVQVQKLVKNYVIEQSVFMEIVQEVENVFVMMVGHRKIVIKVWL